MHTSTDHIHPGPTLVARAAEMLPEVIELRRRLHRHPELGLDLPNTQAAVLDAIEPLGLEVSVGERLSSVVADMHGARPGPTVLLRGDMDALPMTEDSGVEFASEVDGAMHACGHDAHTAMLVGAARLLAERREEFAGTVRFMFQPGEEGDGGAALMIDEGVLDGVDAAFAVHVAPNSPSGMVAWRPGAALASSDEWTIEVTGRGGHASSPHWATDPIPVACEIVLALQTMITRTVDAFEPAVLTTTRLDAGTTHNVIPETARLSGTVRTANERTRAAVRDRIGTVADGIAAAHGCTVTVEVETGYPVTVNDAGFAGFVAEVADATFGTDRTWKLASPVMGSEDFGYVLRQVPGAMVFLGACPPGRPDPFSAPGCHSNLMVLDESAMVDGMALHASVALDFLERGGRIGS